MITNANTLIIPLYAVLLSPGKTAYNWSIDWRAEDDVLVFMMPGKSKFLTVRRKGSVIFSFEWKTFNVSTEPEPPLQ